MSPVEVFFSSDVESSSGEGRARGILGTFYEPCFSIPCQWGECVVNIIQFS